MLEKGQKLNALDLFLILAILAGISLRTYTLSFFEFKIDQALAIEAGKQTAERHFLICRGMTSGAGIPNPPNFFWMMGFFSHLAGTPAQYAGIFLLFSLSSLAIWFFGMKEFLSRDKLLFSTALLAVSSPLTIYSCNIWAQVLLPFFTVLIFIFLCHFLKTGKAVFWILAFWLNALAAGLHLSGFFLFPFTFAFLLNRKISYKSLFAGIVPVMLIFLPYSIYMMGFLSGNKLPRADESWWALASRTIGFMADFNSLEFFKYYFGPDFDRVSAFYAGKNISGILLLAGGTFPIFIFSAAIGFYMFSVAIRRKLISSGEACSLSETNIFEMAGLQMLVIVSGYLALKVKSYPHYFLITIPAGAVLISCFLHMLPLKRIRSAMMIMLCSSMLAMNFLYLLFIDSAGGHYYEYGVHYGTLKQWKKDYEEMRILDPEVSTIKVSPESEVYKTFDPYAMDIAVRPVAPADPQNAKSAILTLKWNQDTMAYEYKWTVGK